MLGIAGVTSIVWHRISVGTDSAQGIVFTLASLASIVTGTILFKLLAPKGSLWLGNGVQNLVAGVVLIPVALTFSDIGAIVPSARLIGSFAFSDIGRFYPRLSAVVSPAEDLRRHRCQRLSLPDAAARHAVRLDGARRAC